MSSPEYLPPELLLMVLGGLDTFSDYNSLALTCRRANNAVSPLLYHRAVRDLPYLLLWACDFGRTGTVRNLLREGANPDAFYSTEMDPHRNIHEYIAAKVTDPQKSLTLSYPVGVTSSRVDEEELRRSYEHKVFWFPMHLAAKGGYDDIIELLLGKDADIDSPSSGLCSCSAVPVFVPADIHDKIFDSSGCECCQNGKSFWSPLHLALCHGHESTALKLVAKGASLEFEHIPHKITHSVHVAAKGGCIGFIKYLLDKHPDFDIDKQDSFGYTPLHWASDGKGYRETIHFLQWRGANIDAISSSFGSLLHLFCFLGRFDAAEFMLESGAAANTIFEKCTSEGPHCVRPIDICCVGATPYWPDSCDRDGVVFMKKLLQWGASLETCPGSQTSLVDYAARKHSVRTLEFLRDVGVDLSRENRAIEQSLMLLDETINSAIGKILDGIYSLSHYSIPRTLDWLLKHGVPVNTSDGRVHQWLEQFEKRARRNLEHWLGNEWIYGVLQDLLNHGLDPNLIYNGKVLFWPLYCRRNLSCCQLLLRYGTYPCHVHSIFDLITTLHQAPTPPEGESEYHRRWRFDKGRVIPEELEFLLECDVQNVLLNSPRTLVMALQRQRIRIAHTLLDKGEPDVTGVSEDGKGCLHHLVASEVTNKRKTYRIMERILELGADPNTADQESGASPLYLALSNKKWAFSRLLIQHGARTDNVGPTMSVTDHQHHHPDVVLWFVQNNPLDERFPREFDRSMDILYELMQDQSSFASCAKCKSSHACMLCPVATLRSRVGHLLNFVATIYQSGYNIELENVAKFIPSLCSMFSS